MSDEEVEGEGGASDEGEDRGGNAEMEDDINVTDSQVMIQLKEAEEEAEQLKLEISQLRSEIQEYEKRGELTEEDAEILQEKQVLLMEKIATLDELTKRIAKLMEFSARKTGEETTVLEEEEEEGFPDDILPRVVICSSWDDMMPKVVVCMDMKKPGAKKLDGDRDENGLTPEQREALEKERRCMAEERNRLQYQIATLEGEMRVMMRENDMLSRKVAQLKADADNQPPFEFEMSVSATQPPGCGPPKVGNMDMGLGVMGPNAGGNYSLGASLAPGAEVQGKMAMPGPPGIQFPPSYGGDGCGGCGGGGGGGGGRCPCSPGGYNNNRGGGANMPCSGPTGVPGQSVACPQMNQDMGNMGAGGMGMSGLPPFGKKCRKDFIASTTPGGVMGMGMGMGMPMQMPMGGGGMGMMPQMGGGMGCQKDEAQNAIMAGGGMKQPPMDLNFKVNVTPQAVPCSTSNGLPGNARNSVDASVRSNKIAQQLQEIEMEVKRMQKEIGKAKKDKDTLRAQQQALNCAKASLL